jgi:small conductance mechanosensitive channel
MILKKLGFDVRVIGKISILSVLVGAVCIFFLLPFLPRLPFKIGHMVEIGGIQGVVDSISTYHTTIRKFDGTIVFVPNTSVMSSKIMNYHDIPERRIEMHLEISINSDINTVKELLLKIMSDNDLVLEEPAPSIFITDADVTGIKISAYCWVKNGDWLSTRSDLWVQVQNTFIQNNKIAMAHTQQEIYLMDKIK